MTLLETLEKLDTIRADIKQALDNKGVAGSDKLSEVAGLIESIESGGAAPEIRTIIWAPNYMSDAFDSVGKSTRMTIKKKNGETISIPYTEDCDGYFLWKLDTPLSYSDLENGSINFGNIATGMGMPENYTKIFFNTEADLVITSGDESYYYQ